MKGFLTKFKILLTFKNEINCTDEALKVGAFTLSNTWVDNNNNDDFSMLAKRMTGTTEKSIECYNEFGCKCSEHMREI